MGRSSSKYSSVIDNFNVDGKHSKYQPKNGTTYCNIFAQDVMRAMGVDFPTGTANKIADSLYGNGFSPWYSVDFKDAQKRANEGHPTVAIKKASGHGHVAVVRPKGSSVTNRKYVQIAQAGTTCYNSTTLNYAWNKADLPSVKFYTCD